MAIPPGLENMEYISWQDYYMALAYLASKRSKDPRQKLGACIVNKEKQVVGVGYNGAPTGFHDNLFPWTSPESEIITCHAEMNAIAYKTSTDLLGCTMYSMLFPCIDCAKLIIQSGIKYVEYLQDYADSQIAKNLFHSTGVTYRQHIPQVRLIQLQLGSFVD